jgi:hypothetical protein
VDALQHALAEPNQTFRNEIIESLRDIAPELAPAVLPARQRPDGQSKIVELWFKRTKTTIRFMLCGIPIKRWRNTGSTRLGTPAHLDGMPELMRGVVGRPARPASVPLHKDESLLSSNLVKHL